MKSEGNLVSAPISSILIGFSFSDSGGSKSNQLCQYLRCAIISGSLGAGSRLPPTRHLAKRLKISRQIVVSAYEVLEAEGLVHAHVGAGTFVVEIPGDDRQETNPAQKESGDPEAFVLESPATGRNGRMRNEDLIEMYFAPDLSHFPYNQVAKISARYFTERFNRHTIYGGGDEERLRHVISHFLRTFRGFSCSSDQIVVTNGRRASLSLIASTLAVPGDIAYIENPSPISTRKILEVSKMRLEYLSLDRERILPQDIRGRQLPWKLLVTNPSSHFLLGAAISKDCRLQLINWARDSHAYIVEDDWDSGLRYSGEAIPTLYSQDKDRKTVIYSGTLERFMPPSVAVGYLVAPRSKVEEFRRKQTILQNAPKSLTQYICAEYLDGGLFSRHLRKVKPTYAQRRKVLIDSLVSSCGRYFRLSDVGFGPHVTVLVENAGLEEFAYVAAGKAGLPSMKLSSWSAPSMPATRFGLAIGFSNIDEKNIGKIVERLGEQLADWQPL